MIGAATGRRLCRLRSRRRFAGTGFRFGRIREMPQFSGTWCATSCATRWLICVGPLLRGTFGGNRGERLAAQDVLHERRQVAARPGLDEHPHAVRVHRLDHPRELDRGHPVVHREVADRVGVGRELLAGRAAVNRRVRRGERHVGEQVAERRPSTARTAACGTAGGTAAARRSARVEQRRFHRRDRAASARPRRTGAGSCPSRRRPRRPRPSPRPRPPRPCRAPTASSATSGPPASSSCRCIRSMISASRGPSTASESIAPAASSAREFARAVPGDRRHREAAGSAGP